MVDEAATNPTAIWIRRQIEVAVQEVVDLGGINQRFAEARPVWSIPEKVVLGQMRESNDTTSFKWLICGDVRTDFIESSAAATPRDAVRHFSLKWQMDAGRYTDPDAEARLIRQAEELYEMAEADHLWSDMGGDS